ncbi:unnamed protein product [Onchocerca flexuosa]|uniref:Exocyst complex component 5 n=1 Tax=Onchocerca flexuosa TaxID=387005 RepID=A0A183HVW4_9BILA|nr:unnamed protein product [Onchocerca flexuosa]
MLSWKIPEIGKQFEALHALANLLVVVPENLNEACSSQLLVSLLRFCKYQKNLYYTWNGFIFEYINERTLIWYFFQIDTDRRMVNSFIQLRLDYRTAKLHLNFI